MCISMLPFLMFPKDISGTIYVHQPMPVDSQELQCLQKNVYYEARNQSEAGMRAVAAVTVNRARSTRFPDNICDVVYQRNKRACQFSWVCQNKKPPLLSHPMEAYAWELSGEIAELA